MPEWFFPARRARSAQIDAHIQDMLEEAVLSSTKLSLGIAAFRLQRQMAAAGVFVSFEHAFYRLRKRDQYGVFVREK